MRFSQHTQEYRRDSNVSPRVIRVHYFNTLGLNEFRRQMQRALDREQEIIPVIIDSYGGQVYSLMAMIDIIEAAKERAIIPTVAEGKAMSCGAVLLSCGTEGHRFVAPNATVMIHDVTTGYRAKIAEVHAGTAEGVRLNDNILSIMSKNCGHEPSYFSDLVHTKGRADWYLTPNECKRHNLANKVRLPKLQIEVKVKFG